LSSAAYGAPPFQNKEGTIRSTCGKATAALSFRPSSSLPIAADFARVFVPLRLWYTIVGTADLT